MKKTLSIILCLFLALGAFAAEVEAEQSGCVSVDFAYYFPAERTTNPGTSWGMINGFYNGLEGRITPWYNVTVKTPGNSALTESNCLTFAEGLEITPVSLGTKSEIGFSPIAFLVFKAGITVATGWDIPGAFEGGMSVYTKDNAEGHVYSALPSFSTFFIEPWVQGTFQFDVAALAPADLADKLHIVLVADYKAQYTTLTGVADGTPWEWQLTDNKFNGWNYYSCITFGYMLPEDVKVLRLAGIQVTFDGYYKNVAAEAYKDYKTDFCTIGLNPTLVLAFDDHNSLAMQCQVKNRRSFATEDTSFSGITNGAEWFFDRVALSYTYAF